MSAAPFWNKIADVIEAHAEELALQETLDNGKPIRETRAADIPLGAEHFRYFAGVILAEEGSVNEIYNEDISIVLREPIGVVGQIIPWNFPFLMAAWKIAPALAAGCTVVIHPSSSTSLSLLSFAQKNQSFAAKRRAQCYYRARLQIRRIHAAPQRLQ